MLERCQHNAYQKETCLQQRHGAGQTPHCKQCSQCSMLIVAIHCGFFNQLHHQDMQWHHFSIKLAGSDRSKASSFVIVLHLQGGGSVNYWVGAVDARNREYAQLMRKFQVEANLHDTTKRALSEQLHDKQALQVSCVRHSCIRHSCMRHGCIHHSCIRHSCIRHICTRHSCIRHSCLHHSCTDYKGLSHCSPLQRAHVCKLKSGGVDIMVLAVICMAPVIMWRLYCTANIADLLCDFSWLGSCMPLLT